MSYILDALKKSEKERKRGKLPDLQTLYVVPPHRKDWHWSWLILGVVIISNLVFAGLWLYQKYFVATEGVGVEEVEVKAASRLSHTTSLELGEITQSEMASEADVVDAGGVIEVSPVQKPLVQDSLTSTAQRQKNAELNVIPNRQSRVSLQQSEIIEDAYTPLQAGETVIRPRQQSIPVPPEPPSARQAQTATSEDPSWRNFPRLRELPRSFQSQIPPLAFSSHMYSSQPDLRLVVINGQNLREKDLFMDNLILEYITESGVILSYEGEYFSISVLKDWSFK